MGAEAASLYQLFVNNGGAGTDFSGVIKFLRG
jgi:3-hydroxyisobutyrate dehydrogenase